MALYYSETLIGSCVGCKVYQMGLDVTVSPVFVALEQTVMTGAVLGHEATAKAFPAEVVPCQCFCLCACVSFVLMLDVENGLCGVCVCVFRSVHNGLPFFSASRCQ